MYAAENTPETPTRDTVWNLVSDGKLVTKYKFSELRIALVRVCNCLIACLVLPLCVCAYMCVCVCVCVLLLLLLLLLLCSA